MINRRVYTLRGWLAFVSLIDYTQSLRSWKNKNSFLGAGLCEKTNSNDNCTVAVSETTSQLLIVYSLQNGTILLVTAFCIHHLPLIFLSILSLGMKINYLIIQVLTHNVRPNFHIIFPVVVHGITLVALMFAPIILKNEHQNDDENEEILKSCNGKPIVLHNKKKKRNMKKCQ